jgi:hypothetical protein
MIDLSHFCRNGAARAALAMLLACASASVISCNLGRACNGTACDQTLAVDFEGDLSPGSAPYDGGILDSGAPPDAIEIDLEEATRTKPTFAPLRTCWLILTAPRQVVCDEGWRLSSGTVLSFSSDITQLRVTMSSNGNQLSQQTITPTYTTGPCGCGAGTSRYGTVTITLPSS